MVDNSTMFTRVFNTVNNRATSTVERHLPMINTVSNSAQAFLWQVNQTRRKKSLMSWYKGIPELTAFVNKVARDVTSQYHFESIDPNKTARNKVMRTNKFAASNQLRTLMKSQTVDMLVTGEGYGWIGKLLDGQAKEAVSNVVRRNMLLESKELKENMSEMLWKEIKAIEGFRDTEDLDEDLLIPKKYRYLPSSTIEIIHDQFDIKEYNHIVGGKHVVFSPEEIVRYTLQEVDGKINGYSSVESILVQLELLRFMWQNMLSVHKNGGSPDKIISLKNVSPNSPAYKRVEEQLLKYKNVENKHGNMLFTGDIQIEDLMQLDQMQFKDMGLYVTGLIAMQWGISRSAIPYIVGGTNTKADVGGDAESSYWSSIKEMQMMFSEDMNLQIWMPHFGVKIVLDNDYHLFNIQIETAKMNKYNNMLTMDNILRPTGKQLTEMSRLKMLGITEKDVEGVDIESPFNNVMDSAAAEGIGTPAQQPEGTPNQGQQNRNARKRDEQETLNARRGKPSGFGPKEKKQIMDDSFDVDLDNFIRLYNEDKAYHPGMPPRLFRSKNDMFTTFTFKSSDFVYRTVVPNDIMDESEIKLMNLGKIYDI